MSQNINITCKFNFKTKILENAYFLKSPLEPVGYLDVNNVTRTCTGNTAESNDHG